MSFNVWIASRSFQDFGHNGARLKRGGKNDVHQFRIYRAFAGVRSKLVELGSGLAAFGDAVAKTDVKSWLYLP